MMNVPGRTNPPRLALGPWLSSHIFALIPCVVLIAYAAPLVGFQLPNTMDALTESYEPLKTLKFVHSKGQDFHKWGPMTSFVYAPAYAVPLAYWMVRGDLGKVKLDFPYGFAHPFEQMGDLILIARLVGLLVACGVMISYAEALARLTGSKVAACLAVTLCMATSPELIQAFAATKPDGLMLAFLAGAMAAYASILAGGLTRWRGALLSVMAVASISCKELTATLFVPAYAAIALWGLMGRDEEAGARRRFLANFAFTIAVGIVAYGLINVAYAPGTWQKRITWWLWGEGKDPAIWAPAGYTLPAYLWDAGRGMLGNLGIGAAALSVVALVWPIASIRDRLAIWIPSLGYLGILLKVAGYMPPYFLSPLNVTLTMPVAVFLGTVGGSRLVKGSRVARAAWAGLVTLACLIGAWSANAGWIRPFLGESLAKEKFCEAELDRRTLVHAGNVSARTPGSSRLTYLGFTVDDRGLNELVAHPAVMPEVILLDENTREWLEQVEKLPARASMLENLGVSYRGFSGIEALGYRLDRVLAPSLRAKALFDFPVAREIYLHGVPSVSVYRRSSP